MDSWIEGQIEGMMDGWPDSWTDRLKNGWIKMDGWMDIDTKKEVCYTR